MRLSVTSTGIRLSMPYWTPYSVGVAFAMQQQTWLKTELANQQAALLQPGQKVGKLHHLHFEQISHAQSATSRVTTTKIIIKIYSHESPTDASVQLRAKKAVHRALKKETEQLLPPRLARLAAQHGFSYRSVSVKQLKRRWGSCDNEHAIILNFFLMELPWDLIDYVLLHELTHTVHLHHGPDFWSRLKQVSPRALDLRHQINRYRPIIQGN